MELSLEVNKDILAESMTELFESAPCGYLATLPNGTIVQVNRTLVEQIGVPREFLLDEKAFSDLLTLPGRMYYETHFGPLLQIQGFIREIAFDLVRKDAPPLPVIVNAVQKRDPNNEPVLVLITIFDATDRRQYEREMLQAKRQAEEATAAEHKAREIAEQASRIKDEFLATLSHELRTPLSAILGWTEILKRKGGLTPDQQNGLVVIERSAQVQSKLINDLMDMSRVLSGKMRLDVQDVHLSETIVAALDIVEPAAHAKAIRLYNVLDPSVMVSGDPGRLQQIFWNLLTNAIKYTPKDGSIRVTMQRVNSHVEVSVRDTGQGMAADFLAHAFERFRQSDSSDNQKTHGLGLGLSIVKNLVEMHGGAITAQSDGPGKGSTFIVHLPVAVLHQRGSGENRVHPHALTASSFEVRGINLQNVKIVLVEDEADSREIIRQILTRSGAEVFAASTAAEGLHLVEQHRPNVLISDIGLPDEDGYELIRKVRMLGDEMGRVRAIALTAFARLEDRTKAMLAGFQIHLAKPADARELIVAVATLASK